MPDTCGRCGRRLKDPFFREIGYGRTCAAKLGITLTVPPDMTPEDFYSAVRARMEGR